MMRFALALIAALSACTQFPELDGTIAPDTSNTTPPELIPLAGLIERANRSTTPADAVIGNLETRLSNLQNRATRLRGPVIDPATRARMLRGVR